jgi:UDP-glucose 4-epimerase
VYVDDIVSANLAAGESAWEGSVNIGTGTETTVLDLARVLQDLRDDGAFVPDHAPPRAGEVRRSAVDPALARDVLGWAPRVELTEGLRRTLASLQG